MSTQQHEDRSFPERLEQAGVWRARLAMDGVAANPAFDAWLNEDPRNARAWEDSRRSWEIFDERGSDRELAAAVGVARDLAQDEQARRRRLMRAGRWMTAAAALVAAVVIGTSVYQRPQAFETAAGARREIQLADGSKVSLDADTLLNVRFSRGRRDLELVRGQAVFDVAHDADRPFAVTAGDRRVIATGTRFNIDMLRDATRITLMEGRVLVQHIRRTTTARSSDLAEPVSLRPGQQLVAEVSSGADEPAAQVADVDTSKALAWKGGQLVFEDEPLTDVVQRVSRYSNIRVEVRDPDLSRHRISGVFPTGDVATFLDALEQHLAIDAIEVSPGRVELRRRPG